MMEKKIVYLFSDGADYSNIVLTDLDAVKYWIHADIESLLPDDDISDREYTIRLARMTQEEIVNLPEAE